MQTHVEIIKFLLRKQLIDCFLSAPVDQLLRQRFTLLIFTDKAIHNLAYPVRCVFNIYTYLEICG